MNKPLFRVKPYAHHKYKFVVRAKLGGKWKRSYFQSEQAALAYARKQNTARATPLSDAAGKKIADPMITAAKTDYDAASTSSQARQKAVVILGMHRSGTSALGGALSRLGVEFGP